MSTISAIEPPSRFVFAYLSVTTFGESIGNVAKTALYGVAATSALCQNDDWNQQFLLSFIQTGRTFFISGASLVGILFPEEIDQWSSV